MGKNIIRITVGLSLAAVIIFTIHSFRVQADEPRKMEINCVNNVRQIGLSVLVWRSDHNDQYPWNVSTNAGGVKELVGVDKDSFITNSWLVFQVMAEELRSPKVLVCPDDKAKTPAADFAHLTASNVTYRIHVVAGMATDKLEGSKIPLATCPVDGNVVYYNGDYKNSKPEADEGGHRPMKGQ
ncbi:MAG: hypothetical protein ABJA67_18620 [Chthonomonadales bacterium]